MTAELAPLPEEPVKREVCLATVWLSCAGVVVDPMPSVCCLEYGHDGWHRAANRGGSVGLTGGPEITWEDSL